MGIKLEGENGRDRVLEKTRQKRLGRGLERQDYREKVIEKNFLEKKLFFICKLFILILFFHSHTFHLYTFRSYTFQCILFIRILFIRVLFIHNFFINILSFCIAFIRTHSFMQFKLCTFHPISFHCLVLVPFYHNISNVKTLFLSFQ